MTKLPTFDPDFADTYDWAQMYRALGLQAVPARLPSSGPNWKRPNLPEWKAFSKFQCDDGLAEQWFCGHNRTGNIGILTGVNDVFILDLDLYKPGCQDWWRGKLDAFNNGFPLDTPTQRTGGGGIQLILRATGRKMPTMRTDIGVDIRGEGGFGVLPPSLHSSGDNYGFLEGYEPWTTKILEAPEWLLNVIDELVAKYGSGSHTGGAAPAVHTDTPPEAINGFGLLQDGREEHMTKLIFAVMTDARRDSPIPLSGKEDSDLMMAAYNRYESGVAARIIGTETKAQRLEQEGRGLTYFKQKWEYAKSQWYTKISEAAQYPAPERSGSHGSGTFQAPSTNITFSEDGTAYNAETGEVIEVDMTSFYRALDLTGIRDLPTPTWLIQNVLPENGVGFIHSEPGVGKSFMALDMAMRIASGVENWFGKAIKQSGTVIYISTEGLGDIKHRVQAWQIHNNSHDDTIPFLLIPDSMSFMADDNIHKLINTIKFYAAKRGKPVLVVVDTVSRVLPGVDENLQKDMTQFIKACDLIRDTFSCTTMCIHHTSKAGTMRGSSVLNGAGDFVYRLEREKGNKFGFMKAEKLKAAEDGWEMAFEMKTIDIPTHTTQLIAEPITSLVCIPASTDSIKPATEPDTAASTYLKIKNYIEDAWKSGRPYTYPPQTKNEGRHAATNISVEFGLTYPAAEQLLKDWARNGVIVHEQFSSKTRAKGYHVIKWE